MCSPASLRLGLASQLNQTFSGSDFEDKSQTEIHFCFQGDDDYGLLAALGTACRELFSLSSDCPLKSDGQKNIYLISSMAAGDLSLLVTVKHPGGG